MTEGEGMEGGRVRLGLPDDANGVLPSQMLERAVELGFIDAGDYRIPSSSIQPASIDLRLGEIAYRIRCSFLPDRRPVEVKLKEFVVDELDLRRDGAVLETNRPYLIPLIEELALPEDIRGKANPKSSTGRLDVFTRIITDQSFRFDEIRPGYRGKLYLEVVPLSFTVRVRQGLALNQLRLSAGRARLTDDEILAAHREQPLLYRDGRGVPEEDLATADGLFLGLDLRGDASGRVGYRAKDFAPALEMSRIGAYDWEDYWDPVRREEGDRIVLAPEHFYLLLSEEAVQIPPGYAAEMAAYDPTSGELRTHYAGFFDPGFGFDAAGRFHGSRAALEVRAHDVPFMIEHGQRVCKLTFERMVEPPKVLYGESIGSAYQGQTDTLGKHFRRPSKQVEDSPRKRPDSTERLPFDDPLVPGG
ncbi:MAG: 2'-deoxycytidine 5'-triphosphate deaminase [Actinomycetota bacterium]|nr:2'-deoxycytidine 5'-triphosphate deaminase [Actinomycetota bacterium]